MVSADALALHLGAQNEEFRFFFWHRLRFHAVAKHLPRQDGFALLDIGAGAGFFGKELSTQFPLASYHFIEPLEFLEHALEKEFGVQRNLKATPSFSDINFITLLDVLEHQERDVDFLRELLAKMGPDTTLILTVPALPFLWSRWDSLLGHYRRYTKSSLIKVLNEAGFDIKSVRYLFPELLLPGIWRAFRERLSASQVNEGNSQDAEFPKLPRWLNNTIFIAGKIIYSLGEFPFGSSLIAVATKK